MGTLKGIIFDVDGTLADTEKDGHLAACNEAFARMGPSSVLRTGPSSFLRTGFDILGIPAVSGSTGLTTGFDKLRTNGCDIEACAEPCRSGLSPNGSSHKANRFKSCRGAEMTRSSPEELFAPVARVAEVAVDGAGGDLGDEGQAPLVLGGLDLGKDRPDEPLVEAGFE